MATLQDGEGFLVVACIDCKKSYPNASSDPSAFLASTFIAMRVQFSRAGASRANDPLAEHDLRMLTGL